MLIYYKIQCDSISSWINNYPTLVYLCSRRIIRCIVSNTFSFPFLRLNFKIQFSPFYVTYEWLFIPPPFLLLFVCTKYVSRYDKNEVWLLLYIFYFIAAHGILAIVANSDNRHCLWIKCYHVCHNSSLYLTLSDSFKCT